MSKRGAIAMDDEEVQAFLASERVLTCASLGRDGWPHVMPLWYVVRDGECWAWTYGKSQKVVNLERESRCTLQVEAGDSYTELRGVMIKAAAAIHRDPEVVRGGRHRARAPLRQRGGARHPGAGREARRAAVRDRFDRLLGSPQASLSAPWNSSRA